MQNEWSSKEYSHAAIGAEHEFKESVPAHLGNGGGYHQQSLAGRGHRKFDLFKLIHDRSQSYLYIGFLFDEN